MNKIFTFSSLLLSGVVLGSIAGRINGTETFKLKRSNVSKNIKSVKSYIHKNEDDDFDQYFI